MKSLRQVFLGIIIALASVGLILGAFSLSLTEGNISTTLAPVHTLTPTYSPTLQPITPLADSLTPSPTSTPAPPQTLTPPPLPSLTPTWTASLLPLPTNCTPPAGWLPYVIQSGDTLDEIATNYRISSSELQQANCLLLTGMLPGVVIYVPPAPTQTPVPLPTQALVPCGSPNTWIVYIVQPGDTLYHLSQAYGINVGQLQRANCMGSSTLLHTGQALYVPPWARTISLPTAPFIFMPTATLANTPIISLPSDTPTGASTSTPTDTPVPVASDTPAEIPTQAFTPTTPAEIPTETLTPTGP